MSRWAQRVCRVLQPAQGPQRGPSPEPGRDCQAALCRIRRLTLTLGLDWAQAGREGALEEMNELVDDPDRVETEMIEFTDEEGYGRFLDLHQLYHKFLNLKVPSCPPPSAKKGEKEVVAGGPQDGLRHLPPDAGQVRGRAQGDEEEGRLPPLPRRPPRLPRRLPRPDAPASRPGQRDEQGGGGVREGVGGGPGGGVGEGGRGPRPHRRLPRPQPLQLRRGAGGPRAGPTQECPPRPRPQVRGHPSGSQPPTLALPLRAEGLGWCRSGRHGCSRRRGSGWRR